MVINKTTSDSRLVNSLVIVGDHGKPIVGVSEFNTDTLVASLDAGGTTEASTYWFTADTDTAALELRDLLVAEDPERVEWSKKKNTKKAMVADALPTNILQVNEPISLVSCTCSNCLTIFVIGVRGNSVYKLSKPNAADVLFTLTTLDSTALTCDSCGEPVAISVP